MQIKEEEYEDELDDQLAASLFQEAEQIGIFQETTEDKVDYK